MENVCPAHPSDNPPNNRRWRNMAERHQRSNGQDNNSSAASDSGTSTDWDGRWGMQECSAYRCKGHSTRNCSANRTMNSGAPGATEITTATTHADWLHTDPAHPDTQVTTIHTFPHAQEMTIPYHQWNHI